MTNTHPKFNFDHHITGLFSMYLSTIKLHTTILESNLDKITLPAFRRILLSLNNWSREDQEFKQIYKIAVLYCEYCNPIYNQSKSTLEKILDDEDLPIIEYALSLISDLNYTKFADYTIGYLDADRYPPNITKTATNTLRHFIYLDPTLSINLAKEHSLWTKNIKYPLIKLLAETKQQPILPFLHTQLNSKHPTVHHSTILDYLHYFKHYSSLPILLKFTEDNNSTNTLGDYEKANKIIADICLKIHTRFYPE
ncbi:hypothetical protein [Bacteroides sp.]|uniref:hypothetical protein n=1 Tax=Bacteroides sp. TaxID=29523 RepID=UPI00260190F5|nr:hypothetical protein [Bacteroides sp.]